VKNTFQKYNNTITHVIKMCGEKLFFIKKWGTDDEDGFRATPLQTTFNQLNNG
jgi:hypothetical protein